MYLHIKKSIGAIQSMIIVVLIKISLCHRLVLITLFLEIIKLFYIIITTEKLLYNSLILLQSICKINSSSYNVIIKLMIFFFHRFTNIFHKNCRIYLSSRISSDATSYMYQHFFSVNCYILFYRTLAL